MRLFRPAFAVFLSLSLVAAVALAAVPAVASGLGSSGAAFLRVAPMARPLAMGNAYTGVAAGIEALGYNPAGLVTIDKWDVGLSQIAYTGDVSFSYAAIGRRVSDRSVVALHLTYMGVDDVSRDGSGNITGRFSNADVAPAVSIGYRATPEIAVGGTLRVVHGELATYTANAVGADFGVKYDPLYWPGITFGASVMNLGTGLTYVNASSPQPLLFRTGVAYEPPHRKFLLSGDLLIDREGQGRAMVGAEYRIVPSFSLRGGFDVGDEATFPRALKLGAGFLSKIGSFDYAFESLGPAAGNSHRFSYSYLGGQPREAKTPGSLFSVGREVASRVTFAVLPFVNLSPSTEHDWLGEGFREIVAARLARQPGLVPAERHAAAFLIDGRFSVIGDDQLWVGMKIVSAADGAIVAYKEAVILQSDLIASTNTLAGAVAGSVPGN